MATMTFTIPDDVEQAFVAAFAAQDLNALVTALMREAIANRQVLQQRRRAAYGRILACLAESTIVTDEQIRLAREDGRP